MAKHDQPVNEPAPEPICCLCVEGMPRCDWHTPEREAVRAASATAGIGAWWERYFAEKENGR